MKKRRSLQLVFAIFIGGMAALYSSSSSQAQRAYALTAQRALIEENCVVCHNQKSKTAGVSLQGLDFGAVGRWRAKDAGAAIAQQLIFGKTRVAVTTGVAVAVSMAVALRMK